MVTATGLRDGHPGRGGTLWPAPGSVPAPAPLPPGCPPVDLRGYHLVVIRSSGGKDSQTALRQVARLAARQGVLHRCVVEYDQLGDQIAWPGTAAVGQHLVDRYGDRPGATELARQQAACCGLRFIARSATSRPNLLDDVRTRAGRDGRRRWPDARNRFCTSDHKRAVGRRLLTELVRELQLPKGEPARVLTVMGFRAQESPGRAHKPVFGYDQPASGKGTVRRVWQWLPIHHWSLQQVWADVHASGVPYAWVYDAGMSRFSCAFCVLASRADLVTAARLLPARAARYAAVEREIGHRFQAGWSMAEVIAAAGREAR